MAVERTLAMIKPDAVEKGVIGEILKRIEDASLMIVGIKMHQLDKTRAEGFYAVHQDKPFFNDLVAFMSSGPSLAIALQGENAISVWRETTGVTNPEEAAEGTIRRDFGTNIERNAVHGSDSPENANTEIGYFFENGEIMNYEWV